MNPASIKTREHLTHLADLLTAAIDDPTPDHLASVASVAACVALLVQSDRRRLLLDLLQADPDVADMLGVPPRRRGALGAGR